MHVEPVALDSHSLLALALRWPAEFPCLFDSAASAPAARWSMLAAHPSRAVWLDAAGRVQRAPRMTWPAAQSGERSDFLSALEREWQAESLPARPAQELVELPPFRGGWLAYLGYELAAQVEPTLRLPQRLEVPVAVAMRVPAVLAFDTLTQRGWLVAESAALPELAAIRERLACASKDREREPTEDTAHRTQGDAMPVGGWQIEEDAPERFAAALARVQEYIRAGDVYQVNLSRRWRARREDAVDLGRIYRALRRSNPAPFAALLQLPGLCVCSSSPERLISARNGLVSTRPIAGTRPRSGRGGADASETAAMLASAKERAEHVMLIDLERNDLGRVCRAGSVEVSEFMSIESYRHVHHIVSNVRGALLPDATPIAALRAVFPGGTITGCPKIRCMQIIAELEGEARGAYTGSLGYLNRDGSMDFNILIRSLCVSAEGVEFRAGAGIVADSACELELAETRAKARGLLAALGAE